MMHITLRQLQLFLAIAKHHSLTKAAESVSLSRSAASMALSELENQFGQPLFDRNKQRLVINRFGERALPYVDELLKRYADLQSLKMADQPLVGQLRLGASDTIGTYLLPKFLSEFRKETGHLDQRVLIGNSAEIFSALEDFQLDIGLVEHIPSSPSLDWKVWRQDRLHIVALPDHLLTQKSAVTLEDLGQALWVAREPGSGMRHLFEERIRKALKTCQITLELNSSEGLVQSVLAGIGLGYFSELSVQYRLKNKELVALNTPISTARDLYVCWHREKYFDPLLRCFMERVQRDTSLE